MRHRSGIIFQSIPNRTKSNLCDLSQPTKHHEGVTTELFMFLCNYICFFILSLNFTGILRNITLCNFT